MRRIPIAVAWLACTAVLLPAPPPATAFDAPHFRLPAGVTPLKHTVELTIDPRQATFAGTMRIDVQLQNATRVLWLNARNLTPRRASVTFGGSQHAARTETTDEFLALELDTPVGPGPAAISVTYQGRLDAKGLAGPYRRKVDGDWYVFTTFTPIEARRAFPCFDEPRFKTPWEISLRVRASDRAFANGAEVSSTPEPNGWKLVRFAATQPLPAEVVAFAAGPFDVFDAPIRVITAKGRAGEGRAAAATAPGVLKLLEDYTGLPYAFGKLDLLAVPDSTYGAVENPGLITFRASGLLLPAAEDTAERRQAIRSLQAHEFAHQWFGDLVTQADWDDVWLSEGFATWLAAKIAGDPLAPLARRERLMAADAAGRAPAVRTPVQSRKDSESVYNSSVYNKGAAILTMLEGWLGASGFQQGLRTYLSRHRFGNASTADLAAALRQATGVDTSAVLDAFLDSTGVPRVAGEMECERHTLRITSTMPHVPVCWRSETGSGCTVVEAAEEVALPEGAACPAWFFLNAGGTGYYRTLWTTDPTAALPHLTEAERMTLMFDLRATGSEFADRVP